jgi:hypothetical protein
VKGDAHLEPLQVSEGLTKKLLLPRQMPPHRCHHLALRHHAEMDHGLLTRLEDVHFPADAFAVQQQRTV